MDYGLSITRSGTDAWHAMPNTIAAHATARPGRPKNQCSRDSRNRCCIDSFRKAILLGAPLTPPQPPRGVTQTWQGDIESVIDPPAHPFPCGAEIVCMWTCWKEKHTRRIYSFHLASINKREMALKTSGRQWVSGLWSFQCTAWSILLLIPYHNC